MNKTKLVIGVVASAIFWPGVIYFATREPAQQRIAREGVETVATIESMEDQHETKHDHRPLMRVHVEGQRNGEPFEASVDQRMTDEELAMYKPGKRVAIKYDPKSPKDIVLVGLAVERDR